MRISDVRASLAAGAAVVFGAQTQKRFFLARAADGSILSICGGKCFQASWRVISGRGLTHSARGPVSMGGTSNATVFAFQETLHSSLQPSCFLPLGTAASE